MAKLIGNAPNQVPTNADLGELAYQDRNAVNINGGTIGDSTVANVSTVTEKWSSPIEDYPEIAPSLLLDFANAKTLDPRITFTRASTGTYHDKSGRLSYAESGEPRFDHDPVTGESKGLLIEEQRTNLFTYSEQFDNAAWSKSNVTISANATTAPDGTTTADKLVEDASTNSHGVVDSITVTLGTRYIVSMYLKQGERRYVRIQAYHGVGDAQNAIFDLSTGSIVSTSDNIGSGIIDVGGGWFRCFVALENSSNTYTTISALLCDDSLTTSYTGDGTSGVYLWGAQLEEGAYPTSYIPTTSSTVTRSADAASMTGTNFSDWYHQDEGTVYVEAGYIKAVANKSQLITDISDGTTANRMYLGKKFNSETLLEAGVNSGNTGQAFMLVTPTTMDGFKSAVAYSVDNMAHSVDASTVETDSSAAMPIGVNSLSFVSGSNSIIKKLAYYPKRLTNTQLQTLTEE